MNKEREGTNVFEVSLIKQLLPTILLSVGLILFSSLIAQAENRQLLLRAVDLDMDESAVVTLADGSKVTVKLLALTEHRDSISHAIRRAEVVVEVNGERVELVSSTYHLPTKIASVQIDCPITQGYYSNSQEDSWGLEKAVRLRLWPADSPLLAEGTFQYPARQRWFATATQMANVPTFVDGGDDPSRKNIYYHSGLDIGGAEAMVDVVAATDGLVVSARGNVLEEYKNDTPVMPRYDVVYVVDSRGWYYRYSHLKEIDQQILPGRRVKIGSPIGVLGKEGASGGWTHLHFEIKSRQPSGKWGTQQGYAFLWEAYHREYHPRIVAVARPHHFIAVGETVWLDATKSRSSNGKIAKFQWQLHDGTTATGPRIERTYKNAGSYSEILKVTDAEGEVDYDFSVVQVIDRNHLERLPPTVHAVYAPTFDIHPNDEVTFKVRSFRTLRGGEVWDFGDGSPEVHVESDDNLLPHNPNGYAVTTHRFKKPGHYVVSARHTNQHGLTGVMHLHVQVE